MRLSSQPAQRNADERPSAGIDRRYFLTATPAALALGACAATPATASNLSVAPVDSMSRADRIQHHAETLLALIRSEFPDDAESLRLVIKSSWGPIPLLRRRLSVEATASAFVWKADEHLRGGGFWVGNELGCWALGVGRY